MNVEVLYGDRDEYGYVSNSYILRDKQGNLFEREGSEMNGYNYDKMLEEALSNLNQFLYDHPQKKINK